MLQIKNKLPAPLLLIMISLLLTIVTATTVNSSPMDSNSTITYTASFYSQSLETRLDTLIESGIISQAQATTILDIYYTYEITTKQDMKTQLDVLVQAKTITRDQEYSILNLFIDLNSNYKNSVSLNEPIYNNTNVDKSEK